MQQPFSLPPIHMISNCKPGFVPLFTAAIALSIFLFALRNGIESGTMETDY